MKSKSMKEKRALWTGLLLSAAFAVSVFFRRFNFVEFLEHQKEMQK